MAVQMPPGLAGMLVKVLGKPESKGDAKGLTGQPGAAQQPGAHGPDALKKGAPLGDGTVLVGVGFNGQDRTGKQQNVHEKDSVARFLKDPELDKVVGRGKPEGKEGADEARGKADERAFEAKELRDAQRNEARREEKADDGKQLQARETQREDQQREREREKQKDERQQQRQDQDERPQYAHGEAEPEQDEPPPQDGRHDADVLGETHQCKGETEDGQRCLRKPLEGSSYCREHLVTTGVPRTVSV